MKEQPMIMYNSDEAATQQTVTGWVSSSGRFWGNDEHMARWEGCTHQVCECGNIHSKNRTKCKACIDKADLERYFAMPEQEWDRKSYVFSNKENEYFQDLDAVLEYCEDNEVTPEDLQLIICDEQYAETIDADDHYCDLLPDDMTLEDIDPQLAKLFDAVNEYIEKNKPVLSWTPGKYRTSIKE